MQGSFAADPTPPAVTRNADVFDLKICDIYIPAGCTKITQAQITDTRLDSSVCGVPVFPVEHLDMTTFYQQIVTDLCNFQQNEQTDFAAWVETQEESHLATMDDLVEVVRKTSDDSVAEIMDLLQQLNDLVDADTVGELITQINDKVSKAGDVLLGTLDTNGNYVTGLPDPVNDSDAVNYGLVRNLETVIWSNASPTSVFAAQTLTVGCVGTTSDKVVIVFKNGPSGNLMTVTPEIPLDDTTVTYEAYSPTNDVRRGFSCYRTSTQFIQFVFEAGTKAAATANDYMVPVKIINIRKVT